MVIGTNRGYVGAPAASDRPGGLSGDLRWARHCRDHDDNHVVALLASIYWTPNSTHVVSRKILKQGIMSYEL